MELHIIVSSLHRTSAGLWGCTQTCPRYNQACIEVGPHCFTWDLIFSTTNPFHPPARASLRTFHSKEWTRARSFTPRLPRHWASSSGGCVWSLSWILKTLQLGLESQLTQRIPARGFRQSLSGIPSAHLFLPFLLPHRRCTGYSHTGEKAICHDRFSLITWVQMWQRNISLEPLRPRTGLVRRSALLSWGWRGGFHRASTSSSTTGSTQTPW